MKLTHTSFNPSVGVLPCASDSQEIFKACATLATVTDVFDAAAVVLAAGDLEERSRSFGQTARLRNTRRQLAVDVLAQWASLFSTFKNGVVPNHTFAKKIAICPV